MKKILGLLIAAFLIGSFQIGQAQEPLTEKYTSLQGTITFLFPAGWAVREKLGTEILFANDEEAFTYFDNNFQFFPGQALIGVWMPEYIAGQVGDEAVTDLAGVGDFFTDDPVEVIDGLAFPTVIAPQKATGRDSILAIAQVAEGAYVGFLLQTSRGGLPTYRPMVLEMINTLEYAPVPDFVLAGGIVWQTRHMVSQDSSGEDAFGRIWDIAVSADDTIYTNDAGVAVNVYSSDGDFIGEIPVELAEGERISDLEFGPDDTLWVLIEKDFTTVRVINFDRGGLVLGELPIECEGWRVTAFQIGPDGSFYVLYWRYLEELVGEGMIRVWDANGSFVRDIIPHSRPSENHVDFSIGPDDLLYLHSMYDFVALDTEGTLVRDLSYPVAWTVDEFTFCPDGSIYITVEDSIVYRFLGSIMVYDNQGNYRYQFPPTPDLIQGADVVEWPDDAMAYFTAMTCLNRGDLLVADWNGEEVRLMQVRFPG